MPVTNVKSKWVSGNLVFYEGVSGAKVHLELGLKITDKDIELGTTTGTKIGTATSQKLGFFNTTPVVQEAHIIDASGGTVIDVEARAAINAILADLAIYGLQAAS